MIEKKIGGTEFTSNVASNDDPYIIGVFGEEGSGKTRLALTGPDGIGCIPTEMKSFKTLDKDAQLLGKRVLKPKDPMALMVNSRKMSMLETDVLRQKEYQKVIARIEDAVFGLLESPDVNMVMIDKFTHYCQWKEYAINGIGENFVKIDGKLVQRKSEVVQGIIDFLSALSQYKKPVLLLCSVKPDFDVVDKDKKPLRNTFNCASFYYLGSHTNLMVETASNPHWVPGSDGNKKTNWHYRLNVRRAQVNPILEGPEGNPLLEDDLITLPGLISQVEPELDLTPWMG